MADFEPILAIKMSSVEHQIVKCDVKGDLFRSEALQISFHNSSKVEWFITHLFKLEVQAPWLK